MELYVYDEENEENSTTVGIWSKILLCIQYNSNKPCLTRDSLCHKWYNVGGENDETYE